MSSDADRHADRLEALLHLPELESPKVSPDGRWVAWSWYRIGPAADVYAAPTDGSQPPIRLTETADETVLVSWAPNNRSVLVAQDQDGNERAQLFRVDLDQPGTLHPLTEPAPNYFLRGGQLHPNERWLVYGANLDAETGQEIEPTWLYRHDLVTGLRMPLARPERGCYYEPRLNAAGTHILYHRADLHPGGRQVWVVDIEGREDRELFSAGPSRKAFASWLPDGQHILILADTETHRRVGIMDRESRALDWLVDDPARCVETAYVPHGSRRVVIVESSAARPHARLLDLDTGHETYPPPMPGNLIPLAPTGTDEWVGRIYSAQQPTDLVRFPLPDRGPERALPVSLARAWERTTLSAADLAHAKDFRWRSVDGLEIQGWLYRPQGRPQGTIVHVHGGPTYHSEDSFDAPIQYLVAEGFQVLDPNYRGSTGFGQAFREAIKVDGWGGREQEDIRAGIEALIAAGIAQPGKVGITGTSYGGYSTWWAITHWPPEIVAAAAPICGMTDLVVDYETTRPDLRPLSEEMMGGSPQQVPERYRERSPLHFVGQIKGRLLIVQGLQDPNVTPKNVRVVQAALGAAAVPYELLAFEDEGHGIQRPKNIKILCERLVQFFGGAF